jgi:hypothetical protein
VRPRPPARALLLAALAALAGCGYRFSQRYVAVGGAERIHVRTFENRSTELDLGAAVTAALREELARRGAEAGEGAPAVLEGEISASEPALTSTSAAPGGPGVTSGTTWRIGVELRARFTPERGAPPVERTVRRDTHYLGGADPLETEGRRALALRRAAGEAAHDLLRALER